MYADEPARDDPFGPPDPPVEVQCIHCGEVFMSSQIVWRPDPSSKDGKGHWCCPTAGCDGVGFGFDIHPVGTFDDDADNDEDDDEEGWLPGDDDDETDEDDDLDEAFLESLFGDPEKSEADPSDPPQPASDDPPPPRDERKERRMKQMGLDAPDETTGTDEIPF